MVSLHSTNKIPRVNFGKKVTLFYRLINSYFFQLRLFKIFFIEFTHIGCFKDRDGNRAIESLESKCNILQGRGQHRDSAIDKCYHCAKKAGYKVFAVQDDGDCHADSLGDYSKHGKSTKCFGKGRGGIFANDVYRINRKLPYIL